MNRGVPLYTEVGVLISGGRIPLYAYRGVLIYLDHLIVYDSAVILTSITETTFLFGPEGGYYRQV